MSKYLNVSEVYQNSTDEIFFLEQGLYICFSSNANLKKNLKYHRTSYIVAFLPIMMEPIIENIGLPYIIKCDNILDKCIFDSIIKIHQTLVVLDKTDYKNALPFLVYFLREYHSDVYMSIRDALIRILHIIDRRIELINKDLIQYVCRLL